MKVYHASPNKIDSFNDNINGTHFGSKESALQSVLFHSPEVIYLHECVIDVSNTAHFDDQGQDWSIAISEAMNENKTSITYTNKFEIGSDKSYVIWDNELIKINKVSILSIDEVDDILNEFYGDEYVY